MALSVMVWVSLCKNRAMPKSATLMVPSRRSMMFWGLMSRWMMPLLWACSRASKIWVVKWSASCQRMVPSCSIYCFKVMPSIYSITMYCSWSPKLTSYTPTMLGWDNRVMAFASLRKRRRKSLLFASSSFRILMATQRSSTRS